MRWLYNKLVFPRKQWHEDAGAQSFLFCVSLAYVLSNMFKYVSMLSLWLNFMRKYLVSPWENCSFINSFLRWGVSFLMCSVAVDSKEGWAPKRQHPESFVGCSGSLNVWVLRMCAACYDTLLLTEGEESLLSLWLSVLSASGMQIWHYPFSTWAVIK